ncbi:MAG: bifunctional glutamate N-acetyltransferase/amino-acid acetyltransferase ArgJ [Myxococcales bacterium]|nr:bifunctional glutamate N-acetyltransferase/amino-acid acetyltransferase ArgJ [Myxococcota bacterium]MDW8281413.1 bifunctional glutamate N-acetyltransferase/amino-acid acetyltransferase ArgJ [Myxococcales bacterium]
MNVPQGFLFSGLCAGIKASRADLALVLATVPCAAAGVFTPNRARAACVQDAAARLPCDGLRAILTNSGNANALTGQRGEQAVREVVRAVAEVLGVAEEAVVTASTGIIGVPLPVHKIIAALPLLRERAEPDPGAAAEAILTTDTRRKIATRSLTVGGQLVRVLGFAKGGGMIHPHLATLLAYVLTDANVAPDLLQRMLAAAARRSFNRLSIDGDMSTNDALFAMASGLAGNERLSGPELSGDAAALAQAIEEVCVDLARAVAADGEGATRRIEVCVSGDLSDDDADALAKAVVRSPLCKAALFGGDPNWGRILAAVGARAASRGLELPLSRLRCAIQGVCVFADGEPCGVPAEELRGLLAGREVLIEIAVGEGPGRGQAWGCDLSYDYVKINAEYLAQTSASADGTITRDGRLESYGPTFKHRLLVEALSYIRRFAGQIAVLKYGGAAMLDEGLKRSFAEDVLRLRDVGLKPVVVHGGGPEINRMLQALGRNRSVFIDGVRVTDKEDMAVVEMVLDGRINSELVALLNQGDHHAIGISGKDGRLLEAVRIRGPRGEDLGEVGEVQNVRTELLTMFLDKGYVPVIAPTAISEDGSVLNVNADDAAAAIAGALRARKLIYLCDVPGLLHNGELVSELSEAGLREALAWPDVAGGMIAKLRSVQRAIQQGVASVHLIDGRVRHALIAELFTDAGVGTVVRAGLGTVSSS